tara:strand:- start:2951 stop:3124 length:174 start_codon:yes stop_codon:yes gene_type:complete
MKVGDIVFAKHKKVIGMIIELTEPTAQFPYQLANVFFIDGVINEVATTTLEIINESR